MRSVGFWRVQFGYGGSVMASFVQLCLVGAVVSSCVVVSFGSASYGG